jgi:serine/threonine protein kinase
LVLNFNLDDLKEEDEEEEPSKRIVMRTVTGLDMYSAPETRQGGEYTEAIDLWGIGIILYFMITGHPPFIDHDENRLKNKVQSGQYE